MTARGALVLLALASGCEATPARVRLVVANAQAACLPSPAMITGMRVIAYATRGETVRAVALDRVIELADLPTDTEQLGVELLDGVGAAIARGKTAPLAFADLPGGAIVPIFMAPANGFCATGDLATARTAPLVARAGDGVLVVGGTSPGGDALGTAEYYDPRTARFVPVAVPPNLPDPAHGFAGCTLVEVPDGTVVLAGIPNTIATFDPRQGLALVTRSLLQTRTFQAALALDAAHLFVIGGCSGLDPGGGCLAPPRKGSFVYSLVDPAAPPQPGPVIAGSSIGGSVFDLGEQSDGVRRFALAGGSGDPGVVDRFAVTDTNTTSTSNVPAQPALLDGGALLLAFARDGAPRSTAAAIVPPDGAAPAAIAPGPMVDGARVIALEDGSVVAIGGDPSGHVARYDPTTNAWTELVPTGDAPGALVAPQLVRLADGSVLVIGGSAGHAWIYRPSLVGPQSGAVAALPFGTADGVVVVPDPSTATRTGSGLLLTSRDDTLAARALIGGPRTTSGKLTITARVTGGVALIAQQLAPGRALVAELVAAQPARIVRIAGGRRSVLCSGLAVDASAGAINLELELRDRVATARVDHAPLVSCDLGADPDAGDRGQWGVAADGTGASVELVTVALAR